MRAAERYAARNRPSRLRGNPEWHWQRPAYYPAGISGFPRKRGGRLQAPS